VACRTGRASFCLCVSLFLWTSSVLRLLHSQHHEQNINCTRLAAAYMGAAVPPDFDARRSTPRHVAASSVAVSVDTIMARRCSFALLHTTRIDAARRHVHRVVHFGGSGVAIYRRKPSRIARVCSPSMLVATWLLRSDLLVLVLVEQSR
jgi:hypothetical protein